MNLGQVMSEPLSRDRRESQDGRVFVDVHIDLGKLKQVMNLELMRQPLPRFR